MKYFHKIETRENENEVIALQNASAGLQVVVGCAPVNLSEEPEKTVNVPIVCTSFEEAKKKLGYSDDFKNYTLCEVMDLSFRKFGVTPVVFINVLDPAKHKKSMEAASGQVVNNQFIVKNTGILLSSVVVTGTSGALSKTTDYIAEFNEDGHLVLTFLTSQTDISVAADVINPEAVTEDDVIGGYNSGDGTETGLEVIRQVYPKTGYVIGQLVCPRWSSNKNVAAVMAAKIDDINGLFNANAIIDISAETYKKYTDLKTAKTEIGINDRDCVLLWPKIKIRNTVYDYSAVWAAAVAYADSVNGDVPYKSPSNRAIGASAAVLEDGAEVYLDNTQAALINSYGIVTALNDQGWRTWGNENAAYPEDTAPKNRYIASRRMMNWYRNRFILAYKEKVSDPTNLRLVETFIDSENQYLNGLVASQYIPSGSHIEYHPEKNPIEQILDGEIVFDTEIAFWTPAKHIVNEIRFNPQLIEAALAGGNE